MSPEPPLRASDFDFELPADLIAQHPLPSRSASRLLHVAGDRCDDRMFGDLAVLLAPGDLLVLNDTRVIKARLTGTKRTGGRVELMVERLLSASEAIALCRASHLPKPGAIVRIDDAFDVEILDRTGRFVTFRARDDRPLSLLLESHGSLPLPPYIERAPEGDDLTRYQTVYARRPGAVAAPTAGLHFDDELLAEVRARGIAIATLTLHVGAGTFLPVEVEDLSQHRMHAERYTIPAGTARAVAEARARGGRVVAVGTTVLRALESAAGPDGDVRSGDGETRLFIVPGYRFRVVERLVTNFHLPRSTLLMLVSAFAGLGRIRAAYRHAIARHYRFFSYGDAMLLERADD
jgi:S-adenosylmethionine:tRNA ribosyltransferase-isomerase